jgi:hypothetical protein
VRLNAGRPGEAEAQLAQIALDGKGTVAVAWQEDRGEAQQEGIYLTRSTDFGATWLTTDLRADDPTSEGASTMPQLALLQDSVVVIAWQVMRHDRKEIAVKVLTPSVGQTSAR